MPELRIELDERDRVYREGEEVSGQVVAVLEKTTRCRKLPVKLLYRAHGSGNTVNQTVIELPVTEADLNPGTHSFPFKLALPAPGEAPLTYHGHHINLDWYVAAHIDIPWARDLDTEQDFILTTNPTLTEAKVPPEPPTHKNDQGGVMIVLGGLGTLAMLALMFYGYAISDDGVDMICCALFGLCFGIMILSAGIKQWLATRVIREPHISCSPWPLHPGSQLTATVRFTPATALTLNGVTIKLEGSEIAIRGSGSNKTTHTHTIFSAVELATGPSKWPKGQEVVLHTTFVIPPDAPCSLELSDNTIAWKLSTEIDIPNWPDWSDSHLVQVTPLRGQHAAHASPPPDATTGPAW